MDVVGYKVQKLSSTKAALWVRFTCHSEFMGKKIQMYPKGLEPPKVPARGATSASCALIPIATPGRYSPRSVSH
jgi:hypothetical protein